MSTEERFTACHLHRSVRRKSKEAVSHEEKENDDDDDDGGGDFDVGRLEV